MDTHAGIIAEFVLDGMIGGQTAAISHAGAGIADFKKRNDAF
ncbi:hypothetical protein [Luteimonas fraxinea]|nr:hypothetical protein [Luteimonas fraxinea]